MIPSGITSATRFCNLLALYYALTFANKIGVIMPIIAPVSISMVDDYQVPKTSCIPARENDGSTIGSKNGLALISAYINPKMAAPIRLGNYDWRDRPGKIATTNINQRPE